MQGFLLTCLLVAVVSAFESDLAASFQSYKESYNKSYKNQAEEAKRFNIFKENVAAIEKHNALYDQGLISYKQGINQFTDMTKGEFRAFLTLRFANKPRVTCQHVMNKTTAPDSMDWRTKGQVTPVKDQGGCSSCWAFSLTGSTEAAYYRKTGTLVSLSEQQLVDCATEDNDGCNGGDLDPNFEKYIKNYGLESELDYPYTGEQGPCQYDPSKVVTKVTGCVSNNGSEDALWAAVGTVGPVSAAMDASNLDSYKSGIYEDPLCSPEKINHAVLIVGYGTEKSTGTDYWIVKNSWGIKFGENGYFRIVRGRNKCGIAEDAVYPTM